MIRLAVAVEGPTEEEFVKRLLAVHLQGRRVETTPVSLDGNVTVQKLAQHVANLVWQKYHYVTSLVDFYGFRGKDDLTPDQLQCAVSQEVNKLIRKSWNQTRVFPYVQRHEFEGLLFSNVERFTTLPTEDVDAACVQELRRIRRQFPTPEDINDSPNNAPSKRISALIPKYSKRVDGPLVAEETGLCRIRAQCPRFHKWLTRLESLEPIA